MSNSSPASVGIYISAVYSCNQYITDLNINNVEQLYFVCLSQYLYRKILCYLKLFSALPLQST